MEGKVVGGVTWSPDHDNAPGPGGREDGQGGVLDEVQGDYEDVERGSSVQTVRWEEW